MRGGTEKRNGEYLKLKHIKKHASSFSSSTLGSTFSRTPFTQKDLCTTFPPIKSPSTPQSS